MNDDDRHRLDIWRKDVASRRPAPSAGLLARLRPLIAAALPRTQAAPALTGAAATAVPEPQQNPGGNPK